MTAPATCGLRLYDVLLAMPDADERTASAKRDVWRIHKVQLPRVVCGRPAGHEGKCVWPAVWRPAMSWWRIGIDPATPDPETDEQIGKQLRYASSDMMRLVGILSGGRGRP